MLGEGEVCMRGLGLPLSKQRLEGGGGGFTRLEWSCAEASGWSGGRDAWA